MKFLGILLLTLTITACGGGGGESTTTPTTTPTTTIPDTTFAAGHVTGNFFVIQPDYGLYRMVNDVHVPYLGKIEINIYSSGSQPNQYIIDSDKLTEDVVVEDVPVRLMSVLERSNTRLLLDDTLTINNQLWRIVGVINDYSSLNRVSPAQYALYEIEPNTLAPDAGYVTSVLMVGITNKSAMFIELVQ